MLKHVQSHWIPIVRSILIAMGLLWLPIEAYEGLSNNDASLPYGCFIALSVIVGIGFYVLDGYSLTGFLKKRVEIKNHGFDTKIFVEFSDLLVRKGWKAIAVNDFFDSNVDEDLVSSRSLHGIIINKFWHDNREDWQKQIRSSLKSEQGTREGRSKGNNLRFPVGSTGFAVTGDNKFLFVALGKTDSSNNVTTASAETLICAVRGMLTKARAVCSYEPLSIPLMGSGLSRIGIKRSVLVDLIIAAVLEETRQGKVTGQITIVLPAHEEGDINLQNYARNWN
ncbi:macro domain-containing protein [Sulfitobacter sp.]|uniref:macro domain-containing protein n=1 Tax=Sulfitobacter sp. TaxID=1903071 RepID=UPI003EF09B98